MKLDKNPWKNGEKKKKIRVEFTLRPYVSCLVRLIFYNGKILTKNAVPSGGTRLNFFKSNVPVQRLYITKPPEPGFNLQDFLHCAKFLYIL